MVRRFVAVVLIAGSCAAASTAVAEETGAAPAAAAAPVRWTLADVITTAIARHPAVGQADAEARAAAARRGQAGSPLYPQVDALAGWAWTEAASSVTGDPVRTKAASVQGTASQLITDFGRTGAGVDRAVHLAAAAREGAAASRVEVAYGAELAYFDVLRAGSILGVRRETLRQRETLLRQAQAFYDAGVKARIEVVRAEANLYQARADATGADHDLRTARIVLLNRMGLDGPADFALEETPAPAEAAGTVEQWLREADANLPDLRALRLQAAAAASARDAARRADAPTVAAAGRIGWAGDDLPLDRSWTAGVQASVPVFNGRLAKHLTSEAEARLAAATYALEDRRRQVRLLVERASQAIADATERLAAREKEREAFAENLRLATGRYEAGAGDIIEIVDAQVQMTAAETAVVTARFDRATAIAALYRALGRLPQP